MTDDSQFGEAITTQAGFSRALTALLVAANGNGVDVIGAWECRTNGVSRDWEAVVTELAMDGRHPGSSPD